jgi:hypothetical protein
VAEAVGVAVAAALLLEVSGEKFAKIIRLQYPQSFQE